MENTLEKEEHSTVNTEEVTNDKTGDRWYDADDDNNFSHSFKLAR
jgi:hypothetical protein